MRISKFNQLLSATIGPKGTPRRTLYNYILAQTCRNSGRCKARLKAPLFAKKKHRVFSGYKDYLFQKEIDNATPYNEHNED